ncbi:MAG: IclR family transcriptional regulator [Aeromicrobium sp.]|uniref:IclR family transcriptional regulator n=1 Tax=Aeromicrobium sp. TaxID=1871063 RepID=UPI0025BE3240|nr:IclR family transcriptional regulator [Aeromicrobium sp.]MCK5892457.1 IclR family transcriptional regulator [Aeromicrobium sp.]MDF1704038.1 IclR family transcriptional regulator [Aeromicrobium sp.]
MATTSVVSAFRVLEGVARLQPVGLSELAREVELPKSTVQRCLLTLQEVGWAESSSSAPTRWSMTLRALSVTGGMGARESLRDVAVPVMHELQLSTTETIHLVAPDGDELVLLERLDTAHSLRAFLPLGERIPLHASATGLAFLSACDAGRIDRYLDGPLVPRTPDSLTDPDRIRDELAHIRERGWSVNVGGLSSGISSLGAPVLDHTGSPVAAVSISGPSSRIEPSRFDDLGAQVAQAAARITQRLRA